MKALLALEDGLVLTGRSFTGPGEATGEVVFNTSMTGYQEILTDPSYKGQIVTMTYTLIGNYGVNPEDVESRGVQAEGFIIKEYHPYPSNWRAKGNLAGLPQGQRAVGSGRHRHPGGHQAAPGSGRHAGHYLHPGFGSGVPGAPGPGASQHGRCQPGGSGHLCERLIGGMRTRVGQNVTTADLQSLWQQRSGKKVVLYDYGVKFNIIRNLKARGLEVLVVPATTPAAAGSGPQS